MQGGKRGHARTRDSPMEKCNPFLEQEDRIKLRKTGIKKEEEGPRWIITLRLPEDEESVRKKRKIVKTKKRKGWVEWKD